MRYCSAFGTSINSTVLSKFFLITSLISSRVTLKNSRLVFSRTIHHFWRVLQHKNLVRIKNRSNQSSERNALIAKGYREDAPIDSISQNQQNTTQNPKKSLSEFCFSSFCSIMFCNCFG